jgi:hypothetical protein
MMTDRRLELAGLIAIGAVLAAPPAQAQVNPLANAVGNVVSQERRTTITASVANLYDSNIAQASDAALARRGLDKSDFRVTPSLAADVYRTIGTGFVSLTGSAGYDFNVRNTELNRERIDTTAGVGAQVSICGISASGGYARRQSNIGDLNIFVQNASVASRNTETIASINGTIACGGTYGLRALLIGGYSDSRNSALARAGSNNHAVTYGGGVEYVQPAVGRIRAYAVERNIDFFRRDGTNYMGAPKVISRAATVSFDRDIGARLSGRIALTYADVKSSGIARSPSFQGLLWDIGLGLRASSRLRFDLDASRSVDPSQGFNVDYIEGQIYGLKGTYAVSQRASLTLRAQHRTQTYRYSTTATILDVNDRTTNAVDGSLRLAANDRFSFSFDAGYTKVDSDNTLFQYSSLRGGVTFAALFN